VRINTTFDRYAHRMPGMGGISSRLSPLDNPA
jgi:hypothetical protein